jgi:hypothetical protein
VKITSKVAGTSNTLTGDNTFTYDPQAALTTIGYDPSRASEPRGWVELNGSAPQPDGALVSLSSDSIAVVPPTTGVPPQPGVNVPAGSSTGNFTLTFQPTPTDGSVTLTATYAGSKVSTPIVVHASPAITLTLGATELNLGDSTQGTVTINTPAPANAAVIISSSDSTAVNIQPTRVPVSVGTFTGTFTVTGNYSGAQKKITITATYDGAETTDWVNVPASPPPPPPPPCKPKKCPKGLVWVQDDCQCEPPM